MKRTIMEVGDELGIIVPKDVAKGLGWKPDDQVVLRVEDNSVSIRSAYEAAMRADRKCASRYHKALRDLSK